MKRSGVADLPLHGGRVPHWLAERMTKLGTAIAESIMLMSRLPVRVGDTLAADSVARMTAVVHEFDEHMSVLHGKSANGEVAITLNAPASSSKESA